MKGNWTTARSGSRSGAYGSCFGINGIAGRRYEVTATARVPLWNKQEPALRIGCKPTCGEAVSGGRIDGERRTLERGHSACAIFAKTVHSKRTLAAIDAIQKVQWRRRGSRLGSRRGSRLRS